MSRIAIENLSAVQAMDQSEMKSANGGLVLFRVRCFRLPPFFRRVVCIRIPVVVRFPLPKLPIPVPGPLGV